MKNILLIALLAFCQFALAQTPKGNGQITGTVVDSTTQQPVPFSTIALTNPLNNQPVDGTVADEKGRFTIAKVAEGEYQVLISFIGYQTKNLGRVRIEDRRDQVELGTVLLSPSVQLLQEVTVQGQRALVEEKVDRTVYNAEADETNKGGDATDVLRRVPMLTVDMDGNVSMRGSQNVRVLINNRPSTITAGSVADALRQIPSDMIRSVEVITSPSARYDAEGSGGIININLKKNNLEGFSLSMDGSAGLRGSNLGINGSYRRGKMGFSLGGFGRGGYNIRGEFENSQRSVRNGTEFVNRQQADTRNQNLFGRYTLGWDYDINKNNFINASVQFGTRNSRVRQDGLFTESLRDGVFAGSSLQNVTIADLSGNVDVNLNYTHNFQKPQREFNLLTQYSRNNRTNDFVRNTLMENDLFTGTRLKNLNDSYNQEITIQADYQTPLAKNQLLEFGGKGIMRKVTSDFRYLQADGQTGGFVEVADNRLSNVFNYDQNISAAYLSYTAGFLKNYTLKAGTRYEYTTIAAQFQNTESEIQIPSFGVIVPSVNLSRKLKNGNTVKAAYNRRIQRPSLQFLNPNVQAANPLNITIGNPELGPEYTNNFEVGYNTFVKATSLNFTAFARTTKNSIGPLRSPVGGDTILTTYQNIGQEDAYGFSLFTNVNISNKLTLSGGTDVYYAVLKNNDPNPLFNAGNQGWVPSLRLFGSYNLTRGWGLQMFSFYRGRQVQLQGVQGGFGIYSLSLRKDLKNKKGSLGFGAENFFTSSIRIRNELNSPLITQRSTNTLYNTNFKINFSYRIGKLNASDGPRRRRKSINNDDLKDGGSSDGAQGAVQGGGAPAGGAAPAGGQPPAQGQRPAKGTGNGQAPQGSKPAEAPTGKPANSQGN